MLRIGEAARALGVSERTLRLYDQLGLVKPSAVSPAGYRLYDGAALARLQAALFYRELGFPLKEIAQMLSGDGAELGAALRDHRALLLLRRQHLDRLISLVDDTLEGQDMTKHRTSLEDIQEAKRRYADEARARWGHTAAYQASQDKGRDEQQELAVAGQADEIFQAFAELRSLPPEDAKVQALVGRWQAFISEHHYPCSKEILAGLGQMYVGDERFTQNLDRFGEGTARLMSEAIAHYCRKG